MVWTDKIIGTKDTICIKCGLVISKKENYIHVEEYDKEKLIKENFMHKKCWEDAMNIKNMALGLAARAFKLIGRAEDITA